MNFLRKIFGQNDAIDGHDLGSSSKAHPKGENAAMRRESDLLLASFASDVADGKLDQRDLAEPDVSLRAVEHDQDELIGASTIVGEIPDGNDGDASQTVRGRKATYRRQVGTGKGRKANTRPVRNADASASQPQRAVSNLSDFSDMEELDDAN